MPPHIRHPELDSGAVEVVAVLLQIPNQVRDDGLDGGSSLGRCFFANTKNPLPESVEGGLCARKFQSSGRPAAEKTKKSSQMCQFLEF